MSRWRRRPPAIAADTAAPPPHVTELGPERVAFAGPTGGVRRYLEGEGLGQRLYRDSALRLCLAWDVTQGALFDDPGTHRLLDGLIDQGVAFLERYAASDGPAELMRLLRADRQVKPFNSLIVRAPGDWELTVHG